MSFLLVLQKKAFRRFMDGRPGPWGAMAVSVFGIRTMWRWSRRDGEVAYRTVLKPGESVVVEHTTDTAASRKRDRKRQRKVDAKAKRHRKKDRSDPVGTR